MNASYELRTPPGVGAIAAIDVIGDIENLLHALAIGPVSIGAIALRDLAGFDRGVVARWDAQRCTLMPHGGIAVIRALTGALERAGATHAEIHPSDAHPEAGDTLEALALHALASADSPRAVDLLLDQPRRWRAWRGEPSIDDLHARSATLGRLLSAPLVVAIGATNIGKSSLLNALARREVSIVHDSPGVTRDAVGASLVLDGLAVRWIDAPGIRETTDAAERQAVERAITIARSAALVILCADAHSGWPDLDDWGLSGRPSVRVGLRSDVGRAEGADVLTSAVTGDGLPDLAVAIRRALVPDETLDDPAPWLFDGRVAATLSFPTDFPRS
jgi:tRNA modification GTPase